MKPFEMLFTSLRCQIAYSEDDVFPHAKTAVLRLEVRMADLLGYCTHMHAYLLNESVISDSRRLHVQLT